MTPDTACRIFPDFSFGKVQISLGPTSPENAGLRHTNEKLRQKRTHSNWQIAHKWHEAGASPNQADLPRRKIPPGVSVELWGIDFADLFQSESLTGINPRIATNPAEVHLMPEICSFF